MELKEHKIGLMIGTTYCGCPPCADDIALLLECENELQIMTNIVKRHAKQDRVTIHQTNPSSPTEQAKIIL